MYSRKPHHNSLILLLILFSVIFLLPACNTNKYLEDGETYVHKNNIILNAEQRIKGKGNLKDELATLYKQRPNKRFLKITRSKLWFYYKTDEPQDTSRMDRLYKKFFAEKPQIYNEQLTEETAENMKYFLRNKGYHDAEVSYTANHRAHTSIVDYHVDLKNLYTIDTIKFHSDNPNILSLLNKNHETSYLKSGENVDGKLYDLEVNRITDLLRNEGYAYFIPNYVGGLEGDSTNYKVNALLSVLIGEDVAAQQTYNIKDILVYPKYYPGEDNTETADTIINGIKYIHKGSDSGVRYSALEEAIYFKLGDLYKQNDFDATTKRFNELGVYKFVSIKFEPDELETNKLNVKIMLTPSKKYVIGYNVDLNNSRYALDDVTLIGTGVSFNLRNRNLRRSAGLMINNIEIGTEVNPFSATQDSSQFFNTVDIKLESDFLIPRFVDPLKIWRGMNRINLVSDKFYKVLQENATTKISASYNYLAQFQFRSHNLFNANFLGYSLNLRSGHQLSLNHFGVNYFSPKTEARFDTILLNNTFLKESFGRQFFTGILLKDFTYTYSAPTDGLSPPFYFRASVEQSGAEVGLLNLAINGLDKPFQIQYTDNATGLLDTILFYHYINLDIEARRFYKIGLNQQFAMRANIGIARPFRPSEEVPYVKQFFVGGPTSIRAWRIRELGPGSYVDPDVANTFSYYQTGDFKMEFNLEYRFPIYWYFEGALFLDAGNIFTFDDSDRPGSKLDGNFINKMAVGAGYGLRFNIQYFILRFDMGMKMRLPYPDENGKHWQMRNWKNERLIDITNFNLAIGYPF